MSEFECRNGHIILGHGRCQECGEKAYYMDGYSARELAAMEADDEEEEEVEDGETNS